MYQPWTTTYQKYFNSTPQNIKPMKLPVSREKYEQMVQERDTALKQVTQLVTENERLTTELESLQNSDAEQRAGDLRGENERLVSELAQAAQNAQSHSDQTAELNTQLVESNTRITDLEQTVERLNQEGAAQTAQATSSNDGTQTPTESLNQFMHKNQDDTMACIQRLRQEGF